MAIKLYTQGLVENVTQDGNKLIFDYVGTKPDTVVEIGEGGSGGDGGGVPFAMTDVAYDKDRNEFTFTFSDNTTKKVRLDGVSDVELDTDTYNLTVTFDNGTTSTYPLGSVSDIAFNAEISALTVTFADGTTKSIPIPTGGSSGESGNGVKNVKIEEIIEDCTYLKTQINASPYKTMKALMGWKVTIEYFDENREDKVFNIERTIFDFGVDSTITNTEARYNGEYTGYNYLIRFVTSVYNTHSPYLYRYTTNDSDEEFVPWYLQSKNKLSVKPLSMESGVMDIYQTERGLFIINAIESQSKYIPIIPVTTGWEEMTGAGFHNSIYRGNNLGSTMTAEQHKEIQDGTFRNMYIGDYWDCGTKGKLYIAAFDYFYGQTPSDVGHHIVLIPSYTSYNPITPNSDRYYNSATYSEVELEARSDLALINANEVTFYSMQVNGSSPSMASTLVEERYSELLNLNQLGYTSGITDIRANYGTNNGCFPLFTFNRSLVRAHYPGQLDTLTQRYWLRDFWEGKNQALFFGGIDNGNYFPTIPQFPCAFYDYFNNEEKDAPIRYFTIAQ